jgi:ferric-dicitrate binding protein FerR (iron transport regulator)
VKDYTIFSVKEFVLDEFFQSWIYYPSDKTNSYWQDWLDENPHKAGDIEEAKSILLRFSFTQHTLPGDEVSMLWTKIRMPAHELKSTSRRPFIYSIAASILLLIIAGVYFLTDKNEVVSYSTAFGETRTITLPDSSTVILNSNSTLTLGSNWLDNKSIREVSLDGEAFFSVIHKMNNQPFKVKTGRDLAIEVLGTSFNVYHREDTKVVLNSGRIQLSLPTVLPNEKVYMKPGDLVEYDEKKYTKRKVDPKLYTAWTENNLVLNHTSLREMIQMIEDNYGLEIVVNENLLGETISGSMPVSNADKLLEQIAIAFRLKLIRDENKIYMRE